MARRRFSESFNSRSATWAGRCAIFALVVAAMCVLSMNLGLVELIPAMATFAGALAFAAFGILLALISFIGIWRHGLGGLRTSIMAIFIGVALLAYPAYLGHKVSKTPEITDITTDPQNPPRFDVTGRLRPRERNDYRAELAARQRTAYPDIEPLQLTASPQVVYDAVVNIATRHKWRVVDARPPVPGRREGTVEAVARSAIMGFRDDVVIRVRAVNATTARVDVRSASRHAFHDFGDNAARVESLLEEIDTAISGMSESKREGEKAAPARRQPQPAKR